MILKRNLIKKQTKKTKEIFKTFEILKKNEIMIIKRKNVEQKEFGVNSKVLGLIAPGGYQAKEAAKYAYDEDEYEDKKMKYAIKGIFTPGTATWMKYQAEKMAEEGKSKEEIKKFLEGDSLDRNNPKGSGRLITGIAEVGLSPAIGSIASVAAYGKGLIDKLDNNRSNFNKNSHSSSKKKNKHGSK